jgi:hypothetical protein
LTAEEISKLIQQELQNEPSDPIIGEVDWNTSLIVPTQQEYWNFSGSDSQTLWTVFEERSDRTGYKIYFSELSNDFGLGFLSADYKLVDLGRYGSFLDTLRAM